MLNLIRKTTLTALSAMTLIGGLSAQAHAENAARINNKISVQSQQALFDNNDVALQAIGFKSMKFSSRRSLNRRVNLRSLSNRRFNNRGLYSSKFGNNSFGHDSFSNRRYTGRRFNDRRFNDRRFSRSRGFSSHINSDLAFKKAKVLNRKF